MTFGLSVNPAAGVFFRHFPVLKRCLYAGLLYATGHSAAYIITSFGLVYFTYELGHYGLWVIGLPILIGFLWGVRHFEKLENQKQHQFHTPLSIAPNELKLAG